MYGTLQVNWYVIVERLDLPGNVRYRSNATVHFRAQKRRVEHPGAHRIDLI